MEYLQAQSLASDPWEHSVLYHVFEPHGREYSPTLPRVQKDRYCVRVTERLFERLKVRVWLNEAAQHAIRIWELIGPDSLDVFPDVHAALTPLRAAGYRLAVVSNWQCGLQHFCAELGLANYFHEILASAEVNSEKPDARIFAEACRRLGVTPQRTLHVGDTFRDDVEGAGSAGLHALLICRGINESAKEISTISNLQELPPLLGVRDGRSP